MVFINTTLTLLKVLFSLHQGEDSNSSTPSISIHNNPSATTPSSASSGGGPNTPGGPLTSSLSGGGAQASLGGAAAACRRDVCVGTSVGTITEPDCLGPCEPGTAVTLEGIVWHETQGGAYCG